MKYIFIFIIRLYQRYISPHKGYRCAYAILHNQPSCSNSVINIIEINGLIRGWQLIMQQFNYCSLAYSKIQKEENNKKKEKNSWCHPCDSINCIPTKGTGESACDCSPF